MEKTAEPKTDSTIAGGGSRKESFSFRDALHVLIVLGGWVLFFTWWGEVLHFTSLPDAAVAILVILGVSLVTALGTMGWVRYNLGIYRRKGPRRTVTDVREDAGTDALGRPLVHPGVDRLRKARRITVSMTEGNGKSLTTEDG